MLEYDIEFGIGKTNIDTECKDEIHHHHTANHYDKIFAKYTEEEYIKGDDREWSKYRCHIMYLKYGEKMSESIKESLPGSSILFSLVFLI